MSDTYLTCRLINIVSLHFRSKFLYVSRRKGSVFFIQVKNLKHGFLLRVCSVCPAFGILRGVVFCRFESRGKSRRACHGSGINAGYCIGIGTFCKSGAGIGCSRSYEGNQKSQHYELGTVFLYYNAQVLCSQKTHRRNEYDKGCGEEVGVDYLSSVAFHYLSGSFHACRSSISRIIYFLSEAVYTPAYCKTHEEGTRGSETELSEFNLSEEQS